MRGGEAVSHGAHNPGFGRSNRPPATGGRSPSARGPDLEAGGLFLCPTGTESVDASTGGSGSSATLRRPARRCAGGEHNIQTNTRRRPVGTTRRTARSSSPARVSIGRPIRRSGGLRSSAVDPARVVRMGRSHHVTGSNSSRRTGTVVRIAAGPFRSVLTMLTTRSRCRVAERTSSRTCALRARRATFTSTS